MKWQIEFDGKAKNELLKLDKQIQKRIIKFLDERVLEKENPKAIGSPLHGNLAGLWRYRVGDYRIICHVQDEEFLVLVISVGHRKNIYKTV